MPAAIGRLSACASSVAESARRRTFSVPALVPCARARVQTQAAAFGQLEASECFNLVGRKASESSKPSFRGLQTSLRQSHRARSLHGG
eukprot:11568109-Alexandrium_andersonii.AAC.1